MVGYFGEMCHELSVRADSDSDAAVMHDFAWGSVRSAIVLNSDGTKPRNGASEQNRPDDGTLTLSSRDNPSRGSSAARASYCLVDSSLDSSRLARTLKAVLYENAAALPFDLYLLLTCLAHSLIPAGS